MGRTGRLRTRKKIRFQAKNDDEVESAHALYKLLGSAGWRNETDLNVRCFSNTGRGLCLKRPIPEGGLLINLPFSSLISLQTLELDLDFKDVFSSAMQETEKELDFQALLAFYIVFHKHQTDSTHLAYINSIPKHFTNPFFCSKDELYFLPDSILQKIVEQNKEIKAAYDWLSANLVRSNCQCCGNPYFPDICSLEQFKWSYFAVNSRCVYVDPQKVITITKNSLFTKLIKDEPKLALAPFLDLFNHSDSAVTVTKLTDSDPHHYELYTGQSYPRYHQAFISYGQLANTKLLIDYGFYLPSNKHDFFEFDLPDIEFLIKSLKRTVHRNKFKFIKDHNLDAQMFVHWHDGCSHNLKVVLYLIFVEDSPFPNVLNQVAFGSTRHFEDAIRDEIKELIAIKVKLQEEFIAGLARKERLTESGKVVLGYLRECVLNLRKFLQDNFDDHC